MRSPICFLYDSIAALASNFVTQDANKRFLALSSSMVRRPLPMMITSKFLILPTLSLANCLGGGGKCGTEL